MLSLYISFFFSILVGKYKFDLKRNLRDILVVEWLIIRTQTSKMFHRTWEHYKWCPLWGCQPLWGWHVHEKKCAHAILIINHSSKWHHCAKAAFITDYIYPFTEAYDREYRRAYKRIMDSKDIADKLCVEDKPSMARVAFCRRLFSNPILQPKLPQYVSNTQLF